MNVQWKSLIVKTTFWIATEILLNLVGLDNLADCGEFVFDRHPEMAAPAHASITELVPMQTARFWGLPIAGFGA